MTARFDLTYLVISIFTHFVIPAKAGIHFRFWRAGSKWIPAFAGMTEFGTSPE